MLNKNIKHFRKAKGLSQEEIAIKLNVVRQTISKWEKGLSVPDADVLIHMAELLDVSVGNLLGIEPDRNDRLNLSEELERLNEQLAPKTRWEKINSTISFKRITKVVRRCCPSTIWYGLKPLSKSHLSSVSSFFASSLLKTFIDKSPV